MRNLTFFALIALTLAPACGGSQRTSDDAQPVGPTCEGVKVTLAEDLEKLDGCGVVDGDLVIYGPALKSIATLTSVTTVRGNLIIGPTASLGSLTGLEQVAMVEGDLTIKDTLRLDSANLPALEKVGGTVRIENNRDLSIIGLGALEVVGTHLFISDNPDLLDSVLNDDLRVAGELYRQSKEPRPPDMVDPDPDEAEVTVEPATAPTGDTPPE